MTLEYRIHIDLPARSSAYPPNHPSIRPSQTTVCPTSPQPLCLTSRDVALVFRRRQSTAVCRHVSPIHRQPSNVLCAAATYGENGNSASGTSAHHAWPWDTPQLCSAPMFPDFTFFISISCVLSRGLSNDAIFLCVSCLMLQTVLANYCAAVQLPDNLRIPLSSLVCSL